MPIIIVSTISVLFYYLPVKIKTDSVHNATVGLAGNVYLFGLDWARTTVER